MDVSVVSVNFRSADHLRKMVASLFAYTKKVSFEVFLINNDTEEVLMDVHSEVKIIDPKKNVGFARGCNLGVKEARGRYIALINPDVTFISDSLSESIAYLDAHPEVGVLGPKLLNPNGTVQPSVRRFPRLLDQVLILLKLPHVFKHVRVIDRYLQTDLSVDLEQDVDQVMGAFFVVRREVFEEIGLLDEAFFFWFEEVDFCKRVVDAKWKVRYVPEIKAVHAGGESFKREATWKKQSVIRKSLRTYAGKHWGRGATLMLWLLDPLFIILAFFAHFFKRN